MHGQIYEEKGFSSALMTSFQPLGGQEKQTYFEGGPSCPLGRVALEVRRAKVTTWRTGKGQFVWEQDSWEGWHLV